MLQYKVCNISKKHKEATLFILKRVGLRDKDNCPHAGPQPRGEVPSVGVVLMYRSP